MLLGFLRAHDLPPKRIPKQKSHNLGSIWLGKHPFLDKDTVWHNDFSAIFAVLYGDKDVPKNISV